MPRRGYPYRRYSDPKQGGGHSLERQEDWPRRLCDEQGWIYDDTFALVDRGRSAFRQKNLSPSAGLTRFLGLIRRGAIAPGSVLIIEHLDRLSRAEVKKAHKVFQEILEAGVWVATKTPFRIYKGEDTDNFFELMEPLWLMYCAHMESKNKSERIAAKWSKVRKDARDKRTPLPTPPRFWLRREGEGYVFSEHENLARQLVNLAVEHNQGADRICRTMTARGIPSPGSSGRWNERFVLGTLRARALVGEHQPMRRDGERWVADGEPIQAFFPSLLTEEQFSALQAALDRRRNRRGRPAVSVVNLFTGLVLEATTRERLQLRSSGQTEQRRYIYLARNHRDSNLIPYEPFEEAMLDTLAALRPEDVVEEPEQLTAREARIKELTARVVALEHRRGQLKAALANPDEDMDEARDALHQVKEALASAAQERDRLKEESRSGRLEVLTEAQTLVQMRRQTSGTERDELNHKIKAALPTVVSEIWVQAQRISARVHVTHAQLVLCSGRVRTVAILPRRRLDGLPLWVLANHDLRDGPFPGR